MAQHASKNGLTQIVSTLTGRARLEEEKARLEAFLNAFPGTYCGIAKDGTVVYHPNFPALLNLQSVESLHDIQNALSAGDASVLEGMFYRLEEKGNNFSIDVTPQHNSLKTYRLSGSKSTEPKGREYYIILWLEDISHNKATVSALNDKADEIESELKRFHQILNTMDKAIWLRNPQGDIIWCNEAYARFLNIPVDQVIKEQKEFSISPKDKGLLKNPVDLATRALQEGSEQKVNCHIIAGGKRYFVEIAEAPLKSTAMSVGFLNDLTREKEASTDYDRTISANKILMEQLRSAIAIFDAGQRLEFFNSSFAQLWSLEEQWLNKKPKLGEILEKLREMRRLPEEADFRHYKQTWLDMFTQLIEPDEDMLYLPDNTALRRTVIPHPMGGLMMTFEDVTSRLELESSYNTLIAVQKETLDNLAEGVAVFGGDGRLKLYNPSFAKIWRFNPEDLESEPHINTLVERMKKFFTPEEWSERRTLLLSTGIERAVQEGRLARTDDMLLEYATVPLPDGGMLISYFDVTDSARVENALREKNTALQVAEQIKTDFLANVSYQLRTPLNAIMGFAEILDQEFFGNLNKKQKEYSQGIQDAGNKLVRLIDDILDLSTIEAGYLDLVMQEFDVYAMLENIHELVIEWARKEKINIVLECEKDIGTLIADERRLKQVLLNLLHNAITYTPEGGKIILAAVRQEETIDFVVTDTGVGISKADQKRVFEPFEKANHERQADMSKTALSRGAGLGLSLVKNIAELHGGSVAISSEVNKGTIITVTLPTDALFEPIL
jgi:signal transduction histidine kinase